MHHENTCRHGLRRIVRTCRASPVKSDRCRALAGRPDLAPPFAVPPSREEWEIQRQQVRAELWKLLGRLPPRPATPKVETLSREDRGGYVVEKFQFDNGAGATVPGYLLLPKNAPGKSPAILYCHWHGGEYGIGKEELFQARHTPGTARTGFRRTGLCCAGHRRLLLRRAQRQGARRQDGKKLHQRRNGSQIRPLGRTHFLGNVAARRLDGAGLPGIAAGSGYEQDRRDRHEHGRNAVVVVDGIGRAHPNRCGDRLPDPLPKHDRT